MTNYKSLDPILLLSYVLLHVIIHLNYLDDRIFLSSAILLLPITNLLRYIFLRLNQTMPPLKSIQNLSRLARARYTLTVTVSQSIMVLIGGFGAIMFLLGDSVNTLYILTSVAGLGVFLYRPQITEYQNIIDALTQLETQNESK